MHLLFDFGGVLVDLDKERCIRAFARLGFDIRPFIGTFAQAGILSQLERGEIGVSAFCDAIRQSCGQSELTDSDIVGAWEDYLLEIPANRLEMLLKARQHYHVHLLSNTNPIHWAQAQSHLFRYNGHTVDDFFEKKFLSFELGVEKPAPEIFRQVVAGIGCPANDILFFDDSEVNCEAAQKEGLQAVLAPAHGEWLKHFDEDGHLNLV